MNNEKLPNLKKILTTQGRNIEYEIRVSGKAKAIRITVYHDSRVIITSPKYVSENVIEKFIQSKALWIFNKTTHFMNNPKTILRSGGGRDYREYKEKALKIVHERLFHFNTEYNFTWKNVTIKNTKGRWGSCSKKGNLNFSYKLALMPRELMDYVVVHELCHLREMNHSEKFWNLVARTFPHYKVLRKELKTMH